MMQIERKDVESYAEVFQISKQAGWYIENLKQGEGWIEIRLLRGKAGPTYGWWRGPIEDFRRFCALTTPPETSAAGAD